MWGKRLFFIFPSFFGALWFVAVQDQIIGEREPRYYLVSFAFAFLAILVGYFVFKKIILRGVVFFGGLYLGFVLGAMIGIQNLLIEFGIGIVLGIISLILFIKVFDAALIVISSAIGSVFIFVVGQEFWNIPEFVLPFIFLIGLSFQFFINPKDSDKKSDKKSKSTKNEE